MVVQILDESQLRGIYNLWTLGLALSVLSIIILQPLAPVTSQKMETQQPDFGKAILLIQKAESAGAPSSEISGLVVLLNKALDLEREALQISGPDEVKRRSELVAQTNEILTTVEAQSVELAAASSQRTYLHNVLTYVSGAVAAFLGTLICSLAISLHAKYRVKRTFQMKVSPK
jgi:hypothetical protein